VTNFNFQFLISTPHGIKIQQKLSAQHSDAVPLCR